MITTNEPKVSVLMSVFNGDRYLQQAIGSILNQSYTDFEFVIVDDGSSQATKEILTAQKDRRIVLITNPSNIGLTKSLNLGLAKCRGEYIARMDSDDISHSERLERQVAFLDQNPEISVTGTQIRVIDHTGKILEYSNISRGTTALSCRWQHLFDSPVAHPSAMFRREIVYNKLGGYDETFTTSQDYELWSRVIKFHEIANLEEVLLDFRSHSGSVSKQYSRENIIKVANLFQNNLTAAIGNHDILSTFGFNWVSVTNPYTMPTLPDYKEVIKQMLLIHKLFHKKYQVDRHKVARQEIKAHIVEKFCLIGLAASDIDRGATFSTLLYALKYGSPNFTNFHLKLAILSLIGYRRLQKLKLFSGFR